jgi:hypothetical protein
LEETLLTYEECATSKEKDKWCSKAINEGKDSLKKNKTWGTINKDDFPRRKGNLIE